MITLNLTDEQYNTLVQMLIQSNPLIQVIVQQAGPQIQARQNENSTNDNGGTPSVRSTGSRTKPAAVPDHQS
jgi:hypothetical protein